MDGDGSMARLCGGPDCCDSDEAVPGNDYWDVPTRCGGYDYNCSGTETKEAPVVPPECAVVELASCNVGVAENAGWVDAPPACGASGTYQTSCVKLGMSCIANDTTAVMRCR